MKQSLRTNPLVIMAPVLLMLALAGCMPPSNPGEACSYFGTWDEDTQLCYVADLSSACDPLYEIYAFTGTDFIDMSDWEIVGCGDLPGEGPEATPEATPISYVIIDPQRGSEKMDPGASFDYEALTCDGKCRIALSALTGAGKRALSSAPGKVIGKTYVQIYDQSGNLDYGDFTLCLYAKGADAPAFYRLGGGNAWSYMGGYWKGSQFCMAGEMSGNYILVD